MKEKTLEALKKSIVAWEDHVKHPEQRYFGATGCPLCQLFHPDCVGGGHGNTDLFCNGCPVKGKTGRGLCAGTPYTWFSQFNGREVRVVGDDKVRKHAQLELDFLKSLLPEESQDE